ncbi:hypothetical protein QWZ06_12120 [Chryseobacterium tructae]|uniref:Bacteriocin n=1 Tax=Chryseobacterium tructae TaxID=1037380 RepID=A0ABV7XXE6_9FLAO|nr:hypothetical protein [Chryseobacterium tructae]MDN3692974.1 hypothetical protein [Chryseobacterium tructae]
MKTKKTLKFSKETVILLDSTSKKTVKGGNQNNYANSVIKCLFTDGCYTKAC